MIIRQIMLATEPPQTFILHFDSRSNAEKSRVVNEGRVLFIDDYKQSIEIRNMADIIADTIQDAGEEFRAQGEMECVKGHAEIKFGERVDRDTVLKTLVNKKKAQKMADGMQRMPLPMGLQT